MFVFKFVVGLFVFNIISGIGMSADFLDFLTTPPLQFPLVILCGFLFVVLPLTLSYFIMAVFVALQLSLYVEISAVVMLFFILVLLLYVRMSAKESYLILATVLAFYLRLPYVVPVVAGLYFGITAIIPIIIGTFICANIPIISALITGGFVKPAAVSIVDVPFTFLSIFKYTINDLTVNQTCISYCLIFTMVFLLTYVISKLSIDFAKDIAIILGSLLNVISFILATIIMKLDISIFSVAILTTVSAVIALVIRFFEIALDYQRAERVSFEDDENVYYVKVVPKVNIAKPKRVVRRIQASHPEEM